jgi:hypothetical protein
MRGVLAAFAVALALESVSAQAQQSFVPSPRVQEELRLTDPAADSDGAPSQAEMAWIALGLDALFNLSTVAAAAAISGGVATLQIVNLGGASTALAFLDVAMLTVQPLAQAFIVYEVGRMNRRYEPQFGWTVAGAYGGTLLAFGVVGLLAAAMPGGGPALVVLSAVSFVAIPAASTVLVQNATMVERPLVSPSQPAASIRF